MVTGMEPKDNVVVREAISGNMYPQGSVFHWRNGWYFCRGEGMAVHIWNAGPAPIPALTISDDEWDSIVGFLSYPKPATPTPQS
jgi:hypothetical protein